MSRNALVTVSWSLDCGCRFPPSTPTPAHIAITPGLMRDCAKHGAQVVTRVTLRLVQES